MCLIFGLGWLKTSLLAEWKPSLGPKIQETWGKIFLTTTLFFFISIFGWTICCVCPSTYESTIPLGQTKGCLHRSTGTTSEVVMDIPRKQPFWAKSWPGAFLGLPWRVRCFWERLSPPAFLVWDRKRCEACSNWVNEKVYITQWIGYLGRVGYKHVTPYTQRGSKSLQPYYTLNPKP